LAAILFPVFAQAREKARQASCLSNEKQIATGFLMYVQDYDETFPIANMQAFSATPQAVWYASEWQNVLYTYIKNVDVYHCPSDSKPYSKTSNTFAGNLTPVSYLYNSHIGADYNVEIQQATSPSQAPPQTLAAIVNPSGLILLAEGHKFYSPLTDDPQPNWGKDYAGNLSIFVQSYVFGWYIGASEIYGYQGTNGTLYPCGLPRHSANSGSNFAFTDGHAKYANFNSAGSLQGIIPFSQTYVDGVGFGQQWSQVHGACPY
jgi:prepilin-type processing-associated H-X9-DG protein